MQVNYKNLKIAQDKCMFMINHCFSPHYLATFKWGKQYREAGLTLTVAF